MNRTPTPEGLVRVVRWALLIFFAYALLTGGLNFRNKYSHPAHPQAASGAVTTVAPKNDNAAPAENKTVDCATQMNPLDNFSLLAGSLLPTRIPVIRTQDTKTGQGMAATCGQHATLHYEVTLESGTRIFSNLAGPQATQVTIGDGTLLRGIEMGVLGMQPGGERRIALPPALGFQQLKNPDALKDVSQFAMKPVDLKNAIILSTVALNSLSPDLPTGQPLRILERRFTTGAQAQCGDTVQVYLTAWKLDGTKIFSTEDDGRPVSFTLGMSEAPFGIEQAVAGMAEGSQRTLIMPPAYAKPLQGDIEFYAQPRLLAAPWPGETVLVELHLDHIGEAPPPAAQPLAPAGPAAKTPPPKTPGPKTPEPKTPEPKADDTKDDDDDTAAKH